SDAVIEREVHRARGASIDGRRSRDSELRGGDAGEVRERDERETGEEARQGRRQRQGDSGASERDRRETESLPPDPIRESADRRPGRTENPEDEHEAPDARAEIEGRPLEAVDDVRETADEREEERRPRHRRTQKAGVPQLTADAAKRLAARGRAGDVDERTLHNDRGRKGQRGQQADRPP